MELISMTDFILNQEQPTYLQKEEFEEAYYKLHNYANFLKMPLKEEMFEGETALFLNFKKIGSKHYENNRYVVIGIGFKNGIHKTIEDMLKSIGGKCYVELSEIAIKRIFGKAIA